MEYTGKMDFEVTALCDALNKIPTLTTRESCCGHGVEPVQVWFNVADMRWLYVIGRCLDRRYRNVQFTCTLDITDRPRTAVGFLLASKTIGRTAYVEADYLARSIQMILDDEPTLECFIREVPPYQGPALEIQRSVGHQAIERLEQAGLVAGRDVLMDGIIGGRSRQVVDGITLYQSGFSIIPFGDRFSVRLLGDGISVTEMKADSLDDAVTLVIAERTP